MRTLNPARLAGLILVLAVSLPALLFVSAAPAHASTGPAWLQAVNSYRVAAGLSPVVESRYLSDTAAAHAYYMAVNKVVTHDEVPGNPGYTEYGAKAGQQSNVAEVPAAEIPVIQRAAVDIWMAAPYHAATILEPRAKSMGFGASGAYAALNVFGDLSGPDLPPTSYPLVWPAQGATIPSTTFRSESPDPRAGCAAAYQGTVGTPLVAWGRDAQGAGFELSSARLVREDGVPFDLCTGPTVHGRTPFVPRYPLAPGYSYTFTVTSKGVLSDSATPVTRTKSSTFKVAPHAVSLSIPSSQYYVSPDRAFAVTVNAKAAYQPGNRSYLNGSVALQWRPRGSQAAWAPLVSRFMGDATSAKLWVKTPERPEFRLVYVPSGRDRSPAPYAYGAPAYKAPGCTVNLLDLKPTGSRVGYSCFAMAGTGSMVIQRPTASGWTTIIRASAPLSWSSATYRLNSTFTSGQRLRMVVLGPDGTELAVKEGTVA